MSVTQERESIVWIWAALYEELPVNTGKTVRYQGDEVALFRLGSGSVKAIRNRCPHKNGVLAEGIVCGEHIFCPMHDRRINLSSGLVQAPDTGCVRTYATKIQDGAVYIGFPASVEKAG